ncbi:MAG: glycosyltransferase family 39 protein [Acidobacteriota bacterium]|nr:glycosyltransferase family 39 protein [Acidobacteriota bacterium]
MSNGKQGKKRFWWLNHNVVATVLIIKVLILVFGSQSYQVVTDQQLNQTNSFFGIWKRWDAVHYLDIAQLGYTAVGEHRFMIVFFPLYPALTAMFNTVFGDYLVSAFLVSGIASIALGLVFRELVRLDYSEKIAQFSVLFLFIFPTSFVLHIPYTESLFLALTVGCFLAARKRSWITVGVLGALACLTRINGLILFPALAFEVWEEYRETLKFNRKWLCLILIPAGFGAYLFLNYYVTGNPTMFMEYQREHWNRYLRFPYYGIVETWKSIFNRTPSSAVMTGFEELLFVLIGLFATVAGWRRLRNSYRVWMAANWLLFVSTSFVLSVPRYTLVLFPLFILMAVSAARSWRLNVLFIVWSILFLSLFTTQFVRGWWAF